MLLIASYGFYMSYEPLYGALIFASTALDYWAARKMEGLPDKAGRKKFMYISVFGNLGTLVFFKYLGFFNTIIADVANLAQLEYTISAWDILLPIGISFYTFQSLSYTIDVYRGDRGAEKHFGYLALYVSFFPQLVAGPIERSTTLLPLLRKKQNFSWHNVIAGLRLVLWGLFKKIVIADRIGPYVNEVHQQPYEYHGFSFVVTGAAFMWQILMDFSAYSDIAIGSAKMLGVDLSINFNRPFRALSIGQFWNRWNISLSTWFRDYLHRPLKNLGEGKNRRLINIMILFTLIGFWHGATWGFVIFGAVHGLYMVASNYVPVFESKKSKVADFFLRRIANIGVFSLLVISLYFFAAAEVADGFHTLSEALQSIFTADFDLSELSYKTTDVIIILGCSALYLFIQNLPNHDPKNPFSSLKVRWLRWGIYYFMIFMIISLAHTQTQDFIYFQF